MILIGIGANLPGPAGQTPRQSCEAALRAMARDGIAPLRCSRWYESAPVPPGPQPWFVNGVALVETALDPARVLARLHDIEAAFGRVRRVVNAPRPLDLDLLDYHGLVRAEDGPPPPAADAVGSGLPIPRLPHPRLHARAFVLLPLAEVAPGWRHPVSGEAITALIARLPPGQTVRPLS